MSLGGGKRQASERLFLFTLIDLLLQMIFVFLLIFAYESSKNGSSKADIKNDAEQALELRTIMEKHGLSEASQVNELLTRLKEEGNGAAAVKADLEAAKKRLSALGLPPCVCLQNDCSAPGAKAQFLATFELYDTGIRLASVEKTDFSKSFLHLLDQEFPTRQDFLNAFKKSLGSGSCRHSVFVLDYTGPENKRFYKEGLSWVRGVFYAREIESR